ncbi:MAG: DUF2933 domain-containing protein [Chloroflexota bacterium]|nr:DUF2933 domain-containing protein [Chloroflexota bacterium]
MKGMCFNWKVIAGLAVVGLGIWAVAPGLAAAALPLLILAACPLSMLLMMRGMQGGHCASRPQQAGSPTRAGLTRDEQLAELRTQLTDIQAQQHTIAEEISRLETSRDVGRSALPADERADARA